MENTTSVKELQERNDQNDLGEKIEKPVGLKSNLVNVAPSPCKYFS